LCLCSFRDSIYLSAEIKEEIILNNIHGRYNFYIQPVNISDKINIDGYGSPLYMIIPKILDFRTKDSISIDFGFDNPEDIKGIRFNLNSNEDLVCEESDDGK
jgi:hypothetical protein